MLAAMLSVAWTSAIWTSRSRSAARLTSGLPHWPAHRAGRAWGVLAPEALDLLDGLRQRALGEQGAAAPKDAASAAPVRQAPFTSLQAPPRCPNLGTPCSIYAARSIGAHPEEQSGEGR